MTGGTGATGESESRTEAGTTPAHEAGVRAVGEFEFANGGTVQNLELAYETYGEYDPDGGPTGDGNAVLVCHALTGSQHVASVPDDAAESTGGDEAAEIGGGQADAWWDDIVGAGKAIDTTECFVICVNVPGSCYGSTGPASEHPDGGCWGSSFPPVTVADWTRAQRRLLTDLGIDRLHAVVGGSVGGMNVLDWVRQFPDAVDRVAPVATAPRLDAQLLGINGVARRAIRGDPNWNGGDYYGPDGCHPDRGLMLARQLGHITYLSKSSMAQKFGREESAYDVDRPFPADPSEAAFPDRSVDTYLDHQASSFADRFDANSYLWLTRAMDEFDLAAGYSSAADALAGFDGEALVLSFTDDWHFTVEASRTLTAAFRRAGADVAHHVVDSDYGHDAFLVEPENVAPPLRSFLAVGVDGEAVRDVDCGAGDADCDDATGAQEDCTDVDTTDNCGDRSDRTPPAATSGSS
ncbi:MAG: homoserine O-acetyltransferase [Halolamina sp.]